MMLGMRSRSGGIVLCSNEQTLGTCEGLVLTTAD